ncbi:MAG: hypothetical protein ABI946_07130 [Chthoniobacterales bacterium]
MRVPTFLLLLFSLVGTASGQIQVDLKFKRLQYIAYEPLIATVTITNLAGRAIDLRDEAGHTWFGFEVTVGEGQILTPMNQEGEPPLRMEAGQTVTRKINLAHRFPVQELTTYHARAHIFFADLNKFFYSPSRAFQVGDARPIWQRSVGIPDGVAATGDARTYSILSNRFPDHTSLYVRVEDKSSGVVYSTFPLGRTVGAEEPQMELDPQNLLHVLHCSAPRTWTYSRIGLNGELVAHATFMETKTRPSLRRGPEGAIAVHGGMLERTVAPDVKRSGPKLSTRPAAPPDDD